MTPAYPAACTLSAEAAAVSGELKSPPLYTRMRSRRAPPRRVWTGTPQALPARSWRAMSTAAAAVPSTAPPFQGLRFCRSSVIAAIPRGSRPTSSGSQSRSIASTGEVSHSPEPSPQPEIPASVSILRKSQSLAGVAGSSSPRSPVMVWPSPTWVNL